MREQSPKEQRPVSWSRRDVWIGVVAFVLWFGLLLLLLPNLSLEIDTGLLVNLAQLPLLLPVWWLVVRKYGVGWGALGLRRFSLTSLGIGCGLMFTAFLVIIAYALLLSLFGQRMQPDLTPIFQDLESPWLFLFGGAILAPLVEEIFFRGFVFAGLRPHYGWQRAAVISAAVFAILHLTPFAAIPIFLYGVIFAYLYQISGSIWPAILMHILNNSFSLGVMYVVANAERWGLELARLIG